MEVVGRTFENKSWQRSGFEVCYFFGYRIIVSNPSFLFSNFALFQYNTSILSEYFITNRTPFLSNLYSPSHYFTLSITIDLTAQSNENGHFSLLLLLIVVNFLLLLFEGNNPNDSLFKLFQLPPRQKLYMIYSFCSCQIRQIK